MLPWRSSLALDDTIGLDSAGTEARMKPYRALFMACFMAPLFTLALPQQVERYPHPGFAFWSWRHEGGPGSGSKPDSPLLGSENGYSHPWAHLVALTDV